MLLSVSFDMFQFVNLIYFHNITRSVFSFVFYGKMSKCGTWYVAFTESASRFLEVSFVILYDVTW